MDMDNEARRALNDAVNAPDVERKKHTQLEDSLKPLVERLPSQICDQTVDRLMKMGEETARGALNVAFRNRLENVDQVRFSPHEIDVMKQLETNTPKTSQMRLSELMDRTNSQNDQNLYGQNIVKNTGPSGGLEM